MHHLEDKYCKYQRREDERDERPEGAGRRMQGRHADALAPRRCTAQNLRSVRQHRTPRGTHLEAVRSGPRARVRVAGLRAHRQGVVEQRSRLRPGAGSVRSRAPRDAPSYFWHCEFVYCVTVNVVLDPICGFCGGVHCTITYDTNTLPLVLKYTGQHPPVEHDETGLGSAALRQRPPHAQPHSSARR